MPISSTLISPRVRYHSDAYDFVFDALRHAQESLQRVQEDFDLEPPADECHLTGGELLSGIRELALQQFGQMARQVFASWGIHCTEDFGRIVFELVDEGRMRKTERDQLSDFYDVFDFEEALERDYQPQTEFSPLA